MEYYDYHDWIAWPESDIREYAREIADDQSLTPGQATHLEQAMAWQAGYLPRPKPPLNGPVKMSDNLEMQFRALRSAEGITVCDGDVFDWNRRSNEPTKEPKRSFVQSNIRWAALGQGLTKKWARKIGKEDAWARRERRRVKKQAAKRPFIVTTNQQVRQLADQAMWAANCYPITHGEWLIARGMDKPYEGLVWYSRALMRTYSNARHQENLGNYEAAMLHAFNAGQLFAELSVRLEHSETFDKAEAVKAAQRGAAQANKKVPDEMRREAYWRFRRDGHKKVEAGRLAGDELGLSESSIRNAFPNAKYPAD